MGEPEKCVLSLRSAAARADPLLRDKVAQWSAATGGLHSLRGGAGGSGTLFALLRGPRPPAGVRWSAVKRPERAAEKVVRAYGGDASWLLDLARQAVVYATASALAEGLRAVARDPEVALARVKNRLRPGYDAAATAGYRDVIVNFRIRSAAARAANVADHVCEVRGGVGGREGEFSPLVSVTLYRSLPCSF